ncbi:MAG: hypothetical protein II454_08820 [Bacteroidales bacterium]|jgi:aspartate kinase|nr:hypothetical protein [Bacteroidales bacterium]
MIVKSFVLKQRSIAQIAALCDESTIAVVRPGKKIEALFRETIRKTVVEKKQAFDEIVAIREHFCAMATGDEYVQKVDETVDTIATYLREAMYVQTTAYALEDYVLAKCSRLCAEAVYHQVGGTLLDGTQLMICHQDAHGNQHFDWAASKEQITRRCKDVKGPVVIAGGFGMLDSGYVTRVGKDGAHMMAALIAAVLGAESIEFHIEAPGVAGIPAMTYDEAAHYCASAQAPFSSSAIWPAKNAGIPILVKNIEDEAFEGTIISTGSAHKTDVISDKGLILVTVYGTGLLGRVGMSGGIFSCLAAAGVNVRFIAQTSSEYSISFAINKADKEAALEAIRGLFQDNPLLPLDDVVVLNQAVGIVTVFGSRMRNLPGTSGNVFGKLGAAGINIIASAQGGEELSISLVVNEADTDKAAELLK